MILRNESYCFFTRQCYVSFPYMERLTFFGHCHVSFPYMEPLSIFGGIVQLILKLVFSDSFVKNTTQRKGASADGKMAAIMLQTIPSFYTKLSEKSLFISANTYEKYIVSKDYCIAHHEDKTCFLPSCKYHILLLGSFEELLEKLDTFCFMYQHVDCLYTLFKYRFSGKVIARNGQVFDNVQQAVDFNHRSKGVDRMTSIAKKRLLRKMYKKHLFSSFQKTKTTQTSGLVFAERIEKVQRTKSEFELIKIVDCFLDGHGNFDSNLVYFKIKSLKTNHSLKSREICINQLVVQLI